MEFWVKNIRIGNKKTDQKGILLGAVLTTVVTKYKKDTKWSPEHRLSKFEQSVSNCEFNANF